MIKLFSIGENEENGFQPENQVQETPVAIDSVEKKLGTSQLSDFMKNDRMYRTLMDFLISKKMISPVNLAWIDCKGGSKGLLVAILKYLQPQGYYKENKRPSLLQIHDICNNTFGIFIGIDTIKSKNYNNVDVNFIPPADTL